MLSTAPPALGLWTLNAVSEPFNLPLLETSFEQIERREGPCVYERWITDHPYYRDHRLEVRRSEERICEEERQEKANGDVGG